MRKTGDDALCQEKNRAFQSPGRKPCRELETRAGIWRYDTKKTGHGKTVGDCATKSRPDAAFPAHWAPDALAFYSGTAFPAKYQGGAFVAFHGSWNRSTQK